MSRFYGIDTSGWPAGKLAAWEANMDKLWAEEVLRDRGGSLGAEQLYYVTWMATGDKKKAQKARARRVLEESRRDQSG